MSLLKHKNKIILLMALSFIVSFGFSQTSQSHDTLKTIISTSSVKQETINTDSIVKHEVSPLDISKNRGLFIIAQDGAMQLRILGSVRLSALYDLNELPIKKTFSTYYIPTGKDNINEISLHNSVNQSRVGFEITRKTGEHTVFIRLETDFNGPGGSYRIRHAYGQIGNLLVGKTWSLFSNVSDLPATVDKDGPTGTISAFAPQIRFSNDMNQAVDWALGLEYTIPDIFVYPTDSIASNITTVQVLPDFTARLARKGAFGRIQLSFVLNDILTKDEKHNTSNAIGYGTSFSGKLNTFNKQNFFFQIAYGKSIAHYISTLNGSGQDAVYNPHTEKYENVTSLGGYLAYAYNWNPRVSTTISLGFSNVFNKSYQTDQAYHNSLSAAFDAFWRILPGARLGMSYQYGQRWDKGGDTGSANRLWALFYYDF